MVKAAAEFWNRHYKLKVPRDYWTCHPIINEYVNTIITPESSNILEWFAKNFTKDSFLDRGLSIGCGTGAADRQAIQAGLCRFIDGYDISNASIEAARREALKADLSDRLHYSVRDLNSLKIPKEHYDFALCVGSLHHVENLEHLFHELKNGLKPGAFIFINEYVGPSRLQWTEKQLKILNRVWEIMPSEYRKAGPLSSVNKEELIKIDPSEAVRSSDIVSLLYDHFEIVAHIEYGGSFLMPFWFQGIVPDVFLENSNIDRQVIIKLLCIIDELILEEKILPNCYAQIAVRNTQPAHNRPLNIPLLNSDRKRWTELWMYSPDGNKKTDSELVKKAFYVLRNEGFISMLRTIFRYSKKLLISKLSHGQY